MPSPLDLAGFFLVLETPQTVFATIDELGLLFPTARGPLTLALRCGAPVMDWNRSVADLDAGRIRSVLGLPPPPARP